MAICPNCHQEASQGALFCGNCATPLAPQSDQSSKINTEDPFVGKCIDDKYYIQKRIAAGGMGVVYLARQKGVGQEVAIKKLHSEYYSNKIAVERLINEARSYGKITHPNAVKLHDLLNVNGQICIIMEFVHGKTLTHYIETGYLFSIRQIVDISLQLADALGTVHRAGIIHRDLKTENVMLLETVSGRYSVKILDFGIAKMMDRSKEHMTQEGAIVGTPEFMSPEQCFGESVDHRSDIYSFGILMYVMICGHLPFSAETALAVLHKQINSPTPSCTRPDGSVVPSDLEAIVEKCLKKKPDDRYQSFSDVIADLICLQEGRKTSVALSQALASEAFDDVTKDVVDVGMSENESVKMGDSEPRPSFSGISIELDEEDEVQNGAFSLDKGELNLEEEKTPDSPAQEEDSDEEYSLGDIPDIGGSLSSLPAIHSESHGSRLPLVIGIILILFVGAGFGMIKLGLISGASHRNVEPDHPDTTLNIGELEVPEPDAAIEPENVDNLPVADGVEPIPEIAPEPVAPCGAGSRSNLERGVGWAMIDQARTLINAGELDDANGVLGDLDKKKSVLSSEDKQTIDGLKSRQDQFSDLWSQANKAKKHQKCHDIDPLVENVPNDAAGMKEKLSAFSQKCKTELEHVPTRL